VAACGHTLENHEAYPMNTTRFSKLRQIFCIFKAMFLSWIDRNADKFSNTEGANFHLITPHSEDKLFASFRTTRENFEAKVMTNKVVTAALLMYSDSRYFEKNGIKTDGKTVNNAKITQTIQHPKGFKITYIEGFLSKKNINSFIFYLLDGFPDKYGIVTELKKYNTENRKLCISWPLFTALGAMSTEQLVWMLKTPQPAFEVDLIRLRITFPQGGTYSIVWKDGPFYFIHVQVPELQPYSASVQDRTTMERMYIRGPVLLDELISRQLGMHIYSFGDHHIWERSICPGKVRTKMTITQLIEETIRAHPDKTIDVFVEKNYSIKNTKTPQCVPCYLTEVCDRFSKELTFDKSNSEYKNARFHYVDIRCNSVFDVYNLLWKNDGFPKKFEAVQESEDPEGLYLRAYHMVEDFIRVASTWFQNGTFTSEILEKAKISQQFRNQRADLGMDLGYHAKEYFANRVAPSWRYMNQDWEKLKEVAKNGDLKSRYKILQSVNKWISGFMIGFQDFYTIGRMFRKYDKSRGNYSLEPARLVILFLGATHTRNITGFLTKTQLFSIVQHSESGKQYQDFQCLEVRSELPLFKYD
jgi:hypothetical protein